MLCDSSYYTSSKLGRIPGIYHGYSTRALGDMRQDKKRKQYLRLLDVPRETLVMGEQVHNNRVVVLNGSSKKLLHGVDGLLVRKNHISSAVAVRVADCVPLLLSDTRGSIIAAVHAGWSGVLSGVVPNAIKECIRLGIHPKDIVAAIGPHIGQCCYAVPRERAMRFMAMFGNDAKLVVRKNKTWYVNIGYAVRRQLRDSGIKADNIDECDICTAENKDQFYSFRRDTKDSFGEILAVIGFESII
jgi:YfiH family protein